MNVIIGLCFGIASAVALAIMLRMALRLRDEVYVRDSEPLERKAQSRSEFKDPPGS